MAQALAGALGIPGGGGAPGAADVARQIAATGNAGQPPPSGGLSVPAALGALPGLMAGGMGGANIGQQLGAQAGMGMPPPQQPWSPFTAVPPQMAQYGMNPHSGVLGSMPGMSAQAGVPPVPQGQAGNAMIPQPPTSQRKTQQNVPQDQSPPQPGKQQAQSKRGRKLQGWEIGEKGAAAGGQYSAGFGYEPWRRPKR